MDSRFLLTSFLALSLSAASVVACGSTTTVTKKDPSATEPDNTGNGPDTEVDPPASMKPIKTSIDPAVIAALQAGGLDVEALPESLDEIVKDKAKRGAVMKSFTIALGVECEGCHASTAGDTDFKAATPQKAIAEKMWSTFVQGLKTTEGKAIYCDSCHQGKTEFLDRKDPAALGAWMKLNFVEKLARRDNEKHGCATCHGDPFKGDILGGE